MPVFICTPKCVCFYCILTSSATSFSDIGWGVDLKCNIENKGSLSDILPTDKLIDPALVFLAARILHVVKLPPGGTSRVEKSYQ